MDKIVKTVIHPYYAFISSYSTSNKEKAVLGETAFCEALSDFPVLVNVTYGKRQKDIDHFLSKLFLKTPKIVVIIDEKTLDLEEACSALKYEPEIVEFKTFVSSENPKIKAHLFEPLSYTIETPIEDKGSKGKKREIPEHYQSWEKYLNWIDKSNRELVTEFRTQISSLPNVIHKPSGVTDYCFYKGKATGKSRFAAFLVRKSSIRVRIRVNPETFTDPKNWLTPKIYKGWFFKQDQERSFDIKNIKQIPYAMELIKQSYDLAE